ncbi:MAG: NAD(P)-binding protein [Candidatus Riflebacteria bacterium]|nr:NAD(P)-binding protein [Candidatus Riflebacteria bacterium]
MTWTRRRVIGAALTLGAGAIGVDRYRGRLAGVRSRRHIEGSVVGTSCEPGHRLMTRLPLPDTTVDVKVLIVGGGASGLSAAWKLSRSGFSEFLLVDVEPRLGGTAACGRSEVIGFPWGAHYVPLPSRESGFVRELLNELGLIEGHRPDGEPIYSERHLCHSPQERIYHHGQWHEGLFPFVGATADDLTQYRAYQALMDRYRLRRDARGRPAFALPLERSGQEPEVLALDRISMREFMTRQGFTSRRLLWYVEYGCRDDYGGNLANVSAWAAIHYSAARPLGEDHQVLTWPEGIGWIVGGLERRLAKHLKTGTLAFSVTPARPGVTVDCLDVATGRVTRYRAGQAILAVPKFIVARIAHGFDALPASAAGFTYAPWIVANLHVDQVPEGRGAPPCWDNVIYDSPGLGYVVATHQQLASRPVGADVLQAVSR